MQVFWITINVKQINKEQIKNELCKHKNYFILF